MALTLSGADPFDVLLNLQNALDTFRASSWLETGPSGTGAYPPINVFQKGDDFVAITEVPGVKKSEIDIQIEGNTIRISGRKQVNYPAEAGIHRRERLAGRFDRAITVPVEIDADKIKAECRDGILAIFIPRSERDKPRSIKVQ